jgi:hypothetical protein
MTGKRQGPGVLARVLQSFGGPRWPPVWMFRQEQVLSGAEEAFEAASAEIMGEVQRRRPARGPFQVTTMALDNGSHLFIMPLQGPGGLAELQLAWRRLAEEVGHAQWAEKAARGNRHMEHFSARIFLEHPGLTVRPDGDAGLGSRAGAFLFDLFHLRPEAEEEGPKVVRELAGLARGRKLAGFTTLTALAGEELPLLVLARTAPDAAELQRREEALREAGGALLDRLHGLARRVEQRRGEPRPRLSHLP